MALTPAQQAILKADILNDATLNAFPNNSDGAVEIAKAYNQTATPAFWVWRTDVSRAEIYNTASPDATFWNWTTYKNQGATEQNAWVQMFMGDRADFSKSNLRSGIAAIFTGSAQANAQRDHCLAMGRRIAKRIEKLLVSVGAGTTSDPGTMTFEGAISYQDVEVARNS